MRLNKVDSYKSGKGKSIILFIPILPWSLYRAIIPSRLEPKLAAPKYGGRDVGHMALPSFID